MNDTNKRLIVVITAVYKGAVGFADIFDCQIKRVVSGTLDEPKISLTILPKDKDYLKFILAHLHPVELEIGFAFNQDNEPYGFSPISGFVSQSKTSWKIEFIREPIT